MNMDKKTKGSWLVHQTGKLQNVNSQSNYENTYFAGKAGILLSAITADNQTILEKEKLEALAKASSINTRLELPNLLNALKQRGLIELGSSGIEVLGVTTAATLQHTADIFEDIEPTPAEQAAIELSEECSIQPCDKLEMKEKLSDSFSLPESEVTQLLSDSETIGFIDTEKIDATKELYFNGNLFRRDDTRKIHAVLSALSPQEVSKVTEFNDVLSGKACISTNEAERMLGKDLFRKLSSIGIYDINVVSNQSESIGFITKPSAFSKFSNSMVEDAFDLAKAFVSSLTYGMTRSDYARGQIRMIEALLKTLIRGEPVGPVSAIANDYKVLELKHVVQVYKGEKNGRHGYLMKLLKKEVGILALEAIQKGDISEQSLLSLPSAAITKFQGPESNREKTRRSQVLANPKATNDMLMVLRTGGGF
jgi:hypothetical protein